MAKKLWLSLTWMAPLLLAPVSSFAATAPQKAPAAKPSAAQAPAPRPTAAKPKTQHSAGRTHRKSRSREKVYTVTPAMLEKMQQTAGKSPGGTIRASSKDEVPFVGFSPTGNSVAGVGLWRMPKVDALDPNRAQPLRNMRGKTTRAAAVGVQLSF